MANYQVRLYDTSGALIAVFDTWKSLSYDLVVNGFGQHTFMLNGDDSRAALFGLDCFVQVLRRYAGGAWYQEYAGFHRTPQYQTQGDQPMFTSYGRTFVDLLHRRDIKYPAGHLRTKKSDKAETVIKEFVLQNAGVDATAPPRWFDGQTTGLSVEADGAQGSDWTGQRSNKNLLDTIREVSDAVGDLDFDVVWDGPGTATFTFKCYSPQLGTDRSATVVFSLSYGNMNNPSYTHSRTEEVTAVTVLGQGVGSQRSIVERTSAATADSPWNRIETTQDARQESTITALYIEADETLATSGAKQNLTFEVVQTPALVYGRDYQLGDIVTGVYKGITMAKKITGVSVTVNDSGESVRITFGD